jgi:hypothetical protein
MTQEKTTVETGERRRDAERTRTELLDVTVRRLAEVTFDHHEAHPAFIKLVGVENAQQAKHMNHVARLVDLNSSAVDLLTGVLSRPGPARPGAPGALPTMLGDLITGYLRK